MDLKNYRLVLFIFGGLFAIDAHAQKKQTRAQYIERYAEIAIDEMKKTGIPASITLAQGILESGDGNSELARKANNHFGIKCHSDWKGQRFFQDDDAKDECFRVYKNPEESFRDHSDFLVNRSRYDFLFEYKPTDYKAWAKGLKKAGYATNPKYPDLLIKIIEDNKLYEFDKGNKKRVLAENSDVRQARQEVVEVEGGYTVNLTENDVKYVLSKGGENAEALAQSLDMREWQIKKYNNVNREYTFKEGSKIYLAPKRNRSFAKEHVVKAGESIWEISQQYAVKPKKIVKRNDLTEGQTLTAGMRLELR